MASFNGIQQVGIGVHDAEAAFRWYRKAFGTDVVIFRDRAAASLMQQYTGGSTHERYAILSMNMSGGGGLEIWQYESRLPVAREQSFNLADLGISIVKIKCRNASAAHCYLQKCAVEVMSPPAPDPRGVPHFYMRDPFGNIFEVIESEDWFSNGAALTGAVSGVVIGVKDIARSLFFYQHILGYDKVIYDREECFPDLSKVAGGDQLYRRVLLTPSCTGNGGFSRLLGRSYIELLECKNGSGTHLYENRYWGDPGFIHVCFDINGFHDQGEKCKNAGFPLTVDSRKGFEMGNASGHFGYIEDPDGTLIELVETHRVPIAKKLGWFLDLRKRNPSKPLPDWLVKCLAFSREKA